MATAELENTTTVDLTIADEAIAVMAERYLCLTVKSVDDKEGLSLVHAARMDVKNTRVAVEKKRKALNEDAVKWQKTVNAEAKRITALLEPIEAHLEHEESIVKREQERLARVAAEQRQALIRERLRLLQECGASYLAEDVAGLSPEDFEALHQSELADKKARDEDAARAEAERQRIAEEQRCEAERLKAEREELERRKQAAETRAKMIQARVTLLANLAFEHTFTGDQLAEMTPADWEYVLETARRQKAERDHAAAVEREQLARQRQEQEAEAKRIKEEKMAIISSRIRELAKYSVPGHIGQPGVVVINENTTEEQYQAVLATAKQWKAEWDAEMQAKVQEEARAKVESEERERQRIEALRPDREKLHLFADELAALSIPALSHASGDTPLIVRRLLQECATGIREVAQQLVVLDV